MQKKQGRHLRKVVHTALLLMATSQTIITPFSVVQAAEQTVASTYRIKAGPLAQSLNEFAALAGVSISQPPALVDGITSRAVNGTYTTRQALDALLDGTGLEAVETAKGVFKLQKKAITGEKQRVLPEIVAADSADVQNLSEVSVSAKADTETAWSPVKGYLARQSATGTKTDSSILETPVSVQVVTREVMDDQVSVNLKDVYENVSGVQQAGNTLNAQTEVLPIIRGFESPNLMRNGLRATNAGAVDLVNVERVEVLKGPASIMYGALEPGGIVNYVTKRPQADASHKVEQQFGSYDFRRTTADSTGALNNDGTLLYRVNVAHTDSNSFRDAMNLERIVVAPSLLWKPSEQTELLVDFSYLKEKQPYDTGIPLFTNGKPRVSRSTTFLESDLDGRSNEDYYAGYQFSHIFNSTWSIRNQLQYHRANNKNESLRSRGIQGNNLQMRYQNEDRVDDEVQFVLDGTAKFKTGAIDHVFVLGAELIEQETDWHRFRANAPNVAISNDPVVNYVPPANQTLSDEYAKTKWASLYFQDQLSLLEDGRLKLLLGGRFDDVATSGKDGGVPTQKVKDQAFTSRAGALFMLTEDHSVYLSASQSFRPQTPTTIDAAGNPLEPTTGRQYEVGLKSALLNQKLLTTFAVYDIEKKNVAVFNQALFNATGQNAYFPGIKQRSRGVELDASGQLTDQIKLIASYAYTDTEVLENKGDPTQVGNRLGGVSPNVARVWLTYDFLKGGDLSGLGMGIGARYVGESTAQFDTNIKLDAYTVADFSLWYRWKNLRASLNIKNLFNEDYIARASDANIAHPGIPRSVFAAASMQF
ncbi:TonB-dependent siderophore receptor [Methylophilus methylotrophus]|uniref:TonB-dependent siderophore receptor n=1 Tax=Methylophilus methylotrophus TaxID=17 RepID=UPI000F5B78A3|nr:TonB-dependent receptor [Methylophilus methylotrophus]